MGGKLLPDVSVISLFFCVVPEVQSTKEGKFVLHNYEITFPEGRILTELS